MGGSPASHRDIADRILDAAFKYHIDTFVETGTYQSESAMWAARLFGVVHTIELDPTLYFDAKDHEKDFPPGRLNVHHGRSEVVMNWLLPTLRTPICWLDAHSMGNDSSGSAVLAELDVISLHFPEIPIVFIDDVMWFELRTKGWPTVVELKAKLKALGLGCEKFHDVFIAERL